MNKRLFARLAWTGLASPLLMMLAHALDGTGFAWLALPLYAPGMLVANAFLPKSAHLGDPSLYIQVAICLNFVFIWIMLLVLIRLFENLYSQKRRGHK
jgi:hypothetical protein